MEARGGQATDDPLGPHLTPQSVFAEVAVNSWVGSEPLLTLTYAVPVTLQPGIARGQLVWIPLRRRLVLGVVVDLHTRSPGFETREVHALVEPQFRLSATHLELAAWIAGHYRCALFEACSPMLPPGATRRSVVHLAATAMPRPAQLTPLARELLRLLDEEGTTSLAMLRTRLGSSLTTVAARLERQGLVERVARIVHEAPRTRETKYAYLRDLGAVPTNAAVADSRPAKQAAVLDLLRRYMRLRSPAAPAREAAGAGTDQQDAASPSATGGEPPWDGLPLGDLYRLTGANRAVLRALEQQGLVEVVGRRAPPEPAVLRPGRYEAPPQLTREQAVAWAPLAAALAARRFASFLLHGVTGSGKTELYLRAAAATIRAGRQVIVLVPEIALASQVISRFANRFPGQVAVLHSSLRDSERYAQWELARTGSRPIVIGPRSALFAPAPDVGLIAIDEEHETAYKQEAPAPRYHARDVARQVARLAGAVLVLGSATPDVGTHHAATRGELTLLELPRRVGPLRADGPSALPLPAVEAVDLRQQLRTGQTGIFSRPLIQLLRDTLAAGEQSILFLNRRGASTIVQCRQCGQALRCPRCEIPLVFHTDRNALLCHRCGGREPRPRRCPACDADAAALAYFGAGTQRVEREVRALLPSARVLRWDQDILSAKVDATRLLARVRAHEVDIIVGTQMVTKGLDLPLVTAIGVINADTMLNLPDFRSSERTFQLLTQVAGRAGRRGPGARAIVQSYSPEHYAIQAALRHDYADFYAEELDFRRRQRYPPFSRLARFVFRHGDEEVCQREGERLLTTLAAGADSAGLTDVDLMGPTPCFVAKIRDLYQWQVIARGGALEQLLACVQIPPGWLVDVDPVSML